MTEHPQQTGDGTGILKSALVVQRRLAPARCSRTFDKSIAVQAGPSAWLPRTSSRKNMRMGEYIARASEEFPDFAQYSHVTSYSLQTININIDQVLFYLIYVDQVHLL
jgi:hypothetical protein